MKKTVPTITITTAAKLSAEQLKELKTMVESKIGEANYEQVVDPSVLGGLKLQLGDQAFDTTIAGRLEKMESQLATAVVTTAVPLTTDQRKKLQAAIEKKYGSVALQEVVDDSVIGGIKVMVGSSELDATIKGKLDRLKQLLLQTV